MREAQRFTEFLQARVEHGSNPRYYRPNKQAARVIADLCGLRSPAIYGVFPGPDAVAFDGLPERFVLKASNLANKRGVFLLRREEGGFHDSFTNKVWDSAAIIDELTRALVKAERLESASIIAEEWVAGENGAGQIPFDYKLYAFSESVELIQQIDRNVSPAQLAFFGPGFTPLREDFVTLGPTVAPGQHVVPANAAAMLDAAKRVSDHLRMPFIRVDMYTSGKDVYLGELTPGPGGPYTNQFRFSPAFDAELGTYWKLALRREGEPIPKIAKDPPTIALERKTAKAAEAKMARMEAKMARIEPKVALMKAKLNNRLSSKTWRLAAPLRHALRRPPGNTRGVPTTK
jgi:hypothetical protein